jgi:hypothetical protein
MTVLSTASHTWSLRPFACQRSTCNFFLDRLYALCRACSEVRSAIVGIVVVVEDMVDGTDNMRF